MVIAFIVSCIAMALDQITKFLVYGTAARSIIGNFLWFESTLNTGVAFSMLQGKTYLFITLSVISSVVFIYLIVSKRFFKSKVEKVCLGAILGGTVGNLIDRLIFKGVRDFIYLKFLNFAIFNVADIAIVVGSIFLCIYILIDAFIFKEKDNNVSIKSNNSSKDIDNPNKEEKND